MSNLLIEQDARRDGAKDERAAIVAWLRKDAAMTREEVNHLHARRKLTIGQTAEWEILIGLKAGLADAIERGQHRG